MDYDALRTSWGVSRTNWKLLRKIAYWHFRKRIEAEGKLWSVLTRQQWAEQCGVTVFQYTRMLTKLRRAGWVESKRGYMHEVDVVLIRLSDAAEKLLLKNKTAHSNTPKSRIVGRVYVFKTAHTGTPLESKKERKTLSKKTCSLSLTSQLPGKTEEKQSTGKMKATQKGKTVSEILAETSSTPATTHKPDTLAELRAAWREGVKVFVTEFKQEQNAQLKMILKFCPPETAANVIRTVLKNWDGYRALVKSEEGVFSSPTEPHIGFLLKHVNTAVKMYASKQIPKKTQILVTAPAVQLTAPVVPDAEKSASVDDLMKILGDE